MLKKLLIKNMYGWRNFEVEFIEDLTLLVGLNGSGKTSLLNVISEIASGKANFLQKYYCDLIELEYQYNKESRIIRYELVEDNQYILTWKNYTIPVDLKNIDSHYNRENRNDEDLPNLESILVEISNELNLLYLPLSRDNRLLEGGFSNSRERYIYERNRNAEVHENWDSRSSRPLSSIDDTLNYINRMVREYQRKTGLRLEQLNNRMRKEMLQTSFSYYPTYPVVGDIQKHFELLDEAKISELKVAFKEMGILTGQFENELDTFIKKLYEGYEFFINWVSQKNEFDTNVAAFISNVSQIERIIKWQKIVQETNSKKALLQEDLNLFLTTVNSFLFESKKELIFNDRDGRILFIQRDNNNKKRVTLDKMSSGEKQIVIFFAYLIFEVNSKQSGIFIIDEPELSLHVSWQRKFAKSIIKAAPNLQLIFATHSPEIVGYNREKCVVIGGDLN